MQIRNGYPTGNTTCAVTNSNAVVIAAAGSDWSQAIVGGYFSRDVEGDPVYEIGAIRAPGVSTSGNWELTLTGNYLGATNAALAYLIHKDFFPNGMPVWNKGDTQFFAIQNRGNAMVDNLLGGAGLGGGPPATFSNVRASPTDDALQVFNPDQNKFFTIRITGPPGDEQVEIATTGET